MTLATDPRRPDLGGNVIGGDERSYTPSLWEHLIETFAPMSVLDVGCGEGHAVKWFDEHAIPSIGIDGLRANIDNAVTRIMWVDLTECAFLFRVGMVWCCEVVEHIDEKHIENLLMTLCNGDVIAMTHALPGQGGHHHVLCREDEYWVNHICSRGYEAKNPEPFRAIARAENPDSWFARSGLVFRRCRAS